MFVHNIGGTNLLQLTIVQQATNIIAVELFMLHVLHMDEVDYTHPNLRVSPRSAAKHYHASRFRLNLPEFTRLSRYPQLSAELPPFIQI